MQLSIDSLKELGAFTGAPVEREITWKQGGKDLVATVFVRPHSYAAAVSDLQSALGRVDGIAARIANGICDDKGDPVFTAADITGEADKERGPLDGNLTWALLTVIGEVNSLGKTPSSVN